MGIEGSAMKRGKCNSLRELWMWQLHGTSFHVLTCYAFNLPSNAIENNVASICICIYN
jgi:hypothetical protein